jgi:hypothetical protein
MFSTSKTNNNKNINVNQSLSKKNIHDSMSKVNNNDNKNKSNNNGNCQQINELYWLQSKYIELEAIIEEKNNQLNQKNQDILELNNKLHEANQMNDEIEWLHRKFIEYQEIIKNKDKEIEEKNKIIEEKVNKDNNDVNGRSVEYSNTDSAAQSRKKWSEISLNNTNEEGSLVVDEDEKEEDNISDGSSTDKNQVIEDQKKLINELELTLEKIYNSTAASVMVQTDDNLIDYLNISEDEKRIVEAIENEPPENTWIYSKNTGIKTIEVEVRNQGNLVKIPAKNDNLIIQNYINKSFNTLNSLRSLNNNINQSVHENLGINNKEINNNETSINEINTNEVNNNEINNNELDNNGINNNETNNVINNREIGTTSIDTVATSNKDIGPSNGISETSYKKDNSTSSLALSTKDDKLSIKEQKKKEKEAKKEMKELEKARKKEEKEKAKKEKEEAKKEKARIKKELKEQKKKS